MKKTLLFVSAMMLAALVLGSLPTASAQTTTLCYVNADANGANTGDSWEDAYTDLQSALGTSPCTEVWVAAGTYLPGTARTDTFTLKNGVAIYGGFIGTEELLSERDVAANVTILSGEQIGDWYQFDNSYHVVTGGRTNSTAILDGFTIARGYANDYHEYPPPPTVYGYGGGIFNVNSSPTLTNLIISLNMAGYGGGIYNGSNSNPILTNVLFSGNKASHLYGGGMHNSDSNPILQNVIFDGNHAGHGGGMYNSNSNPNLSNVTFSNNDEDGTFMGFGGGMCNENNSNPILENVIFNGSTSRYGGGMYNNNSSPSLTEVAFIGNKAHMSGGGMLNTNNSNPSLRMVTFNNNKAWLIQPDPGYEEGDGGGMYNSNSNPTLANVTFYGNTAVNGSAMYNYSSSPILRNITITRNSDAWGSELYIRDSTLVIKNSIFWDGWVQIEGTSPVIEDSLIFGGCPTGATCIGNILDTDPLLGELANNGGFTQTIALLTGSPAIDAGNNATCAATDQRGITRPQGNACDMGAYEVDTPPAVNSIVRADPNPTSKNTIRFTVAFSEPVQNVDASDFALTTTVNMGTSSISEVGGSGAIYTVSVATASGNGTIRLDVKDATDIQDLTNNNILSGFTSGETYTVNKLLTLRSQGSKDGYIWESTELSNVGYKYSSSTDTMYVGDDNNNRQYRTILSFDTSSLHDAAVITSVTLKIRMQEKIGVDPFTTLQYILVDIRNGGFSNNTALQATDFQAAASRNSVGKIYDTPINNWHNIKLDLSSFALINLTGTTQFRLRFRIDDDNDWIRNYISFYSGNVTNPAGRPTLIIEYYLP